MTPPPEPGEREARVMDRMHALYSDLASAVLRAGDEREGAVRFELASCKAKLNALKVLVCDHLGVDDPAFFSVFNDELDAILGDMRWSIAEAKKGLAEHAAAQPVPVDVAYA